MTADSTGLRDRAEKLVDALCEVAQTCFLMLDDSDERDDGVSVPLKLYENAADALERLEALVPDTNLGYGAVGKALRALLASPAPAGAEGELRKIAEFLETGLVMEQSAYDEPPEPGTEWDMGLYNVVGVLHQIADQLAASPAPSPAEEATTTCPVCRGDCSLSASPVANCPRPRATPPAEARDLVEEDYRALFEACAIARDEAGFLGSVPECIKWLCDRADEAEKKLAALPAAPEVPFSAAKNCRRKHGCFAPRHCNLIGECASRRARRQRRTGGMVERELPTSEVAKLCGVKPYVLRKWKARGFLKLAPQGVSGQGRSVECVWSKEATDEALAWSKLPRTRREARGAAQR